MPKLLPIIALAVVLIFPGKSWAFRAQFGLSPDNSRGLLLNTIQDAKTKIVINIYQFDDEEILNALIDKIENKVSVQILVEGEPFGQISPDGKKALSKLQRTMKAAKKAGHRLFVMTGAAGGQRRYRFNHAKYVIVDDTRSLISSENFTGNGFPKTGKKGNRGWQVLLESAVIVKQLNQIFATDTDLSKGDVVDLLKKSAMDSGASSAASFDSENSLIHLVDINRSVPTIGSETGDVTDATLIASPNSLPGLVSFIRSAKKSVALEYMSLPATWKNGTESQSALVSELLAAAERGANVQVLLNDESVFGNGPNFLPIGNVGAPAAKKGNELTVDYLNETAHCKHLDIEARIVDIKDVDITYIHNKGILADGKRALVSSINGTRNSVMDNREIAIALESSDAADYYGRAFDFDWKKSAPAKKVSKCLTRSPLNELMGWQTMPFLQ